MTNKANLFKATKNQDALAENQDLIDSNNSNVRCHEVFSMYPDAASSMQEQEYYDKDRGCSVKAQKNNIFDYQGYLKE
jgi:hypothetical protein